jgi:hypothetical protein
VPAHLHRLAAPAYIVGFVLILFPLVDSVAELWPPSPAAIEWRFGALGLASRALMTPLLGLLVVLGASFVADHASMQWAVGVGAWLFAATVAGLAVLFALDATHMRGLVPDDARAALDLSSLVALAKYLIFAGTSALLGRAGLAQSRETRERWKRRGDQARMVFGSGKGMG